MFGLVGVMVGMKRAVDGENIAADATDMRNDDFLAVTMIAIWDG